jgi:hypothetical protein
MRSILLILICFLYVPVFGQYNFYFGNIHSHTSYSDGNKDSVATGFYYPGDDYNYAKGSYHMDFLGISEHNHYSSNNNPGMHVANYSMGLFQADTANKEGTFICMYGFEYGVIGPPGGHIVTYGVPKLIGWESGSGAWGPTNNYDTFCSKLVYSNYWPIVNLYPNAFCTLAHPQTTDYTNLATTAPYSSVADDAIVGTAIRSGSAFSTTTNYTDPAPTLYESYYFATLAKGYHLGPTADQDNHYTTFGRTSKIRTVVLATALKRDSIMAAYRAMRFYASDDWNAQVTFTVNGNYMGSNFSTTSNSSIYVSVNDPDAPSDPGDNIDSIRIYYGQPGSGINATLLAYTSGSNTLNYTHTTIATNSYYYFARIRQVDGDIIWTSPVWVYRSAVPLPIDLTKFDGKPAGKQIALTWTTAQESGMDRFEIERSVDGTNYQSIGWVPSKFHNSTTSTDYNFTDPLPVNGINFYRLKEINTNGNFNYSPVVAVKMDNPLISIININPNPASHLLTILCNANESTPVTCNFYNSDGRIVKSLAADFIKGPNKITTDVTTLAAGTYFIVLSRPNQRIAEAKFVKE